MAKYTIELRRVCESLTGLRPVGLAQIKYVIDQSIPLLFDQNDKYPIFDEAHRATLNEKIIREYWMREIGFETVELFIFELNSEMNKIMPYYNKLYRVIGEDFDPFKDTDYTITAHGHSLENEKYNEDNKGRVYTNSATESQSDNKNKYSDTPQGALSSVEQGTYLTNYRNVTDANSSASRANEINNDYKQGDNSKDATTVNVQRIKGKRGVLSYAKILEEYHKELFDVDRLVLNELSSLFMGVY